MFVSVAREPDAFEEDGIIMLSFPSRWSAAAHD